MGGKVNDYDIYTFRDGQNRCLDSDGTFSTEACSEPTESFNCKICGETNTECMCGSSPTFSIPMMSANGITPNIPITRHLADPMFPTCKSSTQNLCSDKKDNGAINLRPGVYRTINTSDECSWIDEDQIQKCCNGMVNDPIKCGPNFSPRLGGSCVDYMLRKCTEGVWKDPVCTSYINSPTSAPNAKLIVNDYVSNYIAEHQYDRNDNVYRNVIRIYVPDQTCLEYVIQY